MTTPFLLALAQAAPAQSLGPSGTTVLIEGVAIMAIFYFLLIRPQSKERKQIEVAIMALKRGDEVLTAGGIIGEVVHIQMQVATDGKEVAPSLADRVTIKSGEAKLVVERGRITRVTTKG